jgi:hypothetical protein
LYPTPTKPIAVQQFNTYRAIIKSLFHEQQTKFRMTSSAWEHVWLPHFNKRRDIVKYRKPKIKKATYQEKIDGEFVPYAIADHYNDIEKHLWGVGQDAAGAQVACSALRHRFCLLYGTSGMLQTESIYEAELLDFQGITMEKNDNDVHPIFITIMQIPFGKINKGHT